MDPVRGFPLVIIAALTSLLVGCAGGPTPTSGAQGLKPEELAVVRVAQHGCLKEWNGTAVHIDKFYVGGVEYGLTGDREFLLTPGSHTFMVDYGRCVHGLGTAPDDGVFAGPYGQFKATVEAGATYVLTGEEKLVGPNAVQAVHELRLVRGGSGAAPATTAPAGTEPASRPATPGV